MVKKKLLVVMLAGAMMLRVLTAASDPVEKTEMRLVTESKG